MSTKFDFAIDVICEGTKSGCTVEAETHTQAWDIAKKNYMSHFPKCCEPTLTKCVRYAEPEVMTRAERSARRKSIARFKTRDYLRDP